MKRSSPLRPPASLTLLAGVLALTALASSARAGGISYPALGNIRLDQGTLEIWFTPTPEDLSPQVDSYDSLFSLFDWRVENTFKLSGYWMVKPNRHGIHISASNKQSTKGLRFPGVGASDWKTATPHHFALTWEGSRMKAFADGEPILSQTQNATLTGRLYGQRLVIGGRDSRANPIIVHAVRTSTIPRSPKELAQAQPSADQYTLLLDRFDSEPGEEDRTRPVVSSSLTGERGGQLKGVYHFVREPKPGLAMEPANAAE